MLVQCLVKITAPSGKEVTCGSPFDTWEKLEKHLLDRHGIGESQRSDIITKQKRSQFLDMYKK